VHGVCETGEAVIEVLERLIAEQIARIALPAALSSISSSMMSTGNSGCQFMTSP